MRPNQQNNKNRSRNRNGGRKHANPLSRNYESNGPDVKVRGNAAHIAEKYTQLARDAQSSGDSVMAENYLQHAEHYYRIVMAAQPQNFRPDNGGQENDDDFDGDEDLGNRFASRSERAPERQENVGEADPVAAAANSAVANNAEAPAGEAAEAAPATEGEGDQPRKRERRPRRRRAAAGAENGADPATSPQPEIGELPAFITAGGAAAE